MLSPTTIDISSVKADFEQDFAQGKLRLGAKTTFVNTDNDFCRYDVFKTVAQLDIERSNRFKYMENINVAYL